MGLADGFKLFIAILKIAAPQCIVQSVSFAASLTNAEVVRKSIFALR